MTRLIWIFLFLVISIFGYSQDSNDKNLIKKTRFASNEAIKNHDLKAIATFWDEKTLITTGGGVLLINREEIIAVLERSFSNNKDLYYVRTPRKIKISKDQQRAWETGRWKSYGTDRSYQGKYTAMWVRVGGEWKIRSQLFVGL